MGSLGHVTWFLVLTFLEYIHMRYLIGLLFSSSSLASSRSLSSIRISESFSLSLCYLIDHTASDKARTTTNHRALLRAVCGFAHNQFKRWKQDRVHPGMFCSSKLRGLQDMFFCWMPKVSLTAHLVPW